MGLSPRNWKEMWEILAPLSLSFILQQTIISLNLFLLITIKKPQNTIWGLKIYFLNKTYF